ncbi:MAG: hypothetical protein FWD87_06130 [Spirochaetaceae bacterium]|nr:hypothetical protein [Spirochaetaceae bacterium]
MINHSIKKIYLIFLLLSLFLLLPQCGLHSFPYLEPPSIERIGETFRITNTNDNPEVFRGYELFYKFYDIGDSSGVSDDIRFITSFTQPDPRPIFTRARRFFRINTAPDIHAPPTGTPNIFLGSGNRHGGFAIDIIFDGIGISTDITFNPRLVYSGQDIPLFRDVTDPDPGVMATPNVNYKSFGNLRNINVPAAPRDQDLPMPAGEYHVTLYLWIFARGIYNNTPIFSRPVELGNISYFR